MSVIERIGHIYYIYMALYICLNPFPVRPGDQLGTKHFCAAVGARIVISLISFYLHPIDLFRPLQAICCRPPPVFTQFSSMSRPSYRSCPLCKANFRQSNTFMVHMVNGHFDDEENAELVLCVEDIIKGVFPHDQRDHNPRYSPRPEAASQRSNRSEASERSHRSEVLSERSHRSEALSERSQMSEASLRSNHCAVSPVPSLDLASVSSHGTGVASHGSKVSKASKAADGELEGRLDKMEDMFQKMMAMMQVNKMDVNNVDNFVEF